MYLRYIRIRLAYKIGVNEYLENHLFDKKEDYSVYFEKLHTYIHKWEYCSKHFAGDKTKGWLKRHHIQYLFFKMIYPGLDAMDYFRYEFYRLRHKDRKTFITEGYLRKMNFHFNPKNSQTLKAYKILDDKREFNKFFDDFIKRSWTEVKDNEGEFVSFCLLYKTIILKPSVSGGGQGIQKVEVTSKNEAIELFNKFNNKNMIVEEVIKQSDEINLINSSSINTIRIYSIISNNQIYITGATFRFGNGKSAVDNYSSGNYAASVDEKTGKVTSSAVSQNGERITTHPISGAQIVGFKIPNWEHAIEMVIEAHKKLMSLRYIGWDVAFNSDNEPLLVEGNTFAGVELQQHPSLTGKKPIYKKYW